ncbi:MAG TPA: hypothetical protein DHN33_04865 [Eubacteriaceae bacterium]|nr:hypothetical protein [Eubacteriaceae bacterium]
MEFYEKLDYLMHITKTSNSTLAKAIAIDASYISRLRKGSRQPSAQNAYMEAMAAYFAKRSSNKYQMKLLKEIMECEIGLVEQETRRKESILRWLMQELDQFKHPVKSFLKEVSDFHFVQPQSTAIKEHIDLSRSKDQEVFFGVEGKRAAVLQFLKEIVARDNPDKIFIHSDEEMSWLTEDSAFLKEWSRLLAKAVQKGNRIQIIHNINRSLNEILDAINNWLPLYMSGMIEPFYYPKIKDGIFRRTLFVAPKASLAVVSNSVGESTENKANFLYRDPKVVQAFKSEYLEFHKMCRSLIKIYTSAESEQSLDLLTEFENEKADTYLRNKYFSFLTMPHALLRKKVMEEASFQGQKLLDYHENRIKYFKSLLETHKFTEIISLYPYQDGETVIPLIGFTDLFKGLKMEYDREEYRWHLRHVLNLLKEHGNYHVVLLDPDESQNYSLYAKENIGVIASKLTDPVVRFAVNEAYMTAAFWDYIENQIRALRSEQRAKEDVVKQLEKYMENL